MFKNLNVKICGDRKVQVQAIRSSQSNPEDKYALIFYKDGLEVIKIALEVNNGNSTARLNLMSDPFDLANGLYTIKYRVFHDGKLSDKVYEYGEVMVGDKDAIEYKIDDEVCYNTNGLRVRLRSEVELNNWDVYYQINNEDLKDIKYYIPFNKEKIIDFFVKGVRREQFSLDVSKQSFVLKKFVESGKK